MIDAYVCEERQTDVCVSEDRVGQIYSSLLFSEGRQTEAYVSEDRVQQRYTSLKRDRQTYMSLTREYDRCIRAMTSAKEPYN